MFLTLVGKTKRYRVNDPKGRGEIAFAQNELTEVDDNLGEILLYRTNELGMPYFKKVDEADFPPDAEEIAPIPEEPKPKMRVRRKVEATKGVTTSKDVVSV